MSLFFGLADFSENDAIFNPNQLYMKKPWYVMVSNDAEVSILWKPSFPLNFLVFILFINEIWFALIPLMNCVENVLL